ncbi:ribosome small subunit-dependent GTPase A [Maioricimonas sp. JC845]|uniref:ribosome small subunit-dependent GTPase A n=1 Tax=Maioricimonas sp. JC845 TaxID=3232138 RepID=UPI00345A9961
MADKRKKKVRVAFRKNRQKRTRSGNLTRQIRDDLDELDQFDTGERISGKGELTRHRTIIADDEGGDVLRKVDESACLKGRVRFAIGANNCQVETPDGRLYQCTVRRVLRTLLRQTRSPVVTGDNVLFQPEGDAEGVIERVEPRRGTLSRVSRGLEHVIAANSDQALIVGSAAEPQLKPSLIDRFLVSAGKGGLHVIICINKVDLTDAAALQTVAGTYARLGYDVVMTSAIEGHGVDHLRRLLHGRQTLVAGQSGVGKSSLLNAIQPGLGRATSSVSRDSGKGRHTTRVTELFPLTEGGAVIDTPGIRQFELWDVISEEVEAFFIEFRPFVAMCRFPDCSHTHEDGCAVKRAVADGHISRLRYESYVRIMSGDS